MFRGDNFVLGDFMAVIIYFLMKNGGKKKTVAIWS